MHTPSEGQAKAYAQVEAHGLNQDFEDEVEGEALLDDLDETVNLTAQTTQANSTGLSLSELDDLLKDEDFEPLDTLDALLSESLELAQVRKHSSSLRRKLKLGQATPAEADEYARIDLQTNWTPVAACMSWDRWACKACGNLQGMFTGHMVEYSHAHNSEAVRLIRTGVQRTDLPLKHISRDFTVESCVACSDDVIEAMLACEPYMVENIHTPKGGRV